MRQNHPGYGCRTNGWPASKHAPLLLSTGSYPRAVIDSRTAPEEFSRQQTSTERITYGEVGEDVSSKSHGENGIGWRDGQA
jgi:hypothetical protein